jgi:hypothetical protein
MLGIACLKFGVIASPGLCAAAGVATARQAAMMTALIFMAVAFPRFAQLFDLPRMQKNTVAAAIDLRDA